MNPLKTKELTLRSATKKPLNALLLLSGSLLLSLGLCACSIPNLDRVALNQQNDSPKDESLFIESLNPELLESDLELLKNTSKPVRALTLSTAWLSKSRYQLTHGSPGAISSMLRAIQLTLSGMEMSGCESFASKRCKSLNEIQREAIFLLFSTLQDRSWIAPKLAPSRYRFSQTAIDLIQQLQNWEITLPTTPRDLLIDRSGIGLPLAGCRKLRKARICTPLTAVVSFREELSSDLITADISIIDSYQQEVLSTHGKSAPVAASFSKAVELVKDSLVASGQLVCLSTPTSSTGVVLIPHQSSSNPADVGTFLLSVATNPSVRNAFTPCVTSIQVSHSMPQTRKLAQRAISNLTGLTRPQLPTSTIKLALINLANETIPFSTILATTLNPSQTNRWSLCSVGVPPFLLSAQNARHALEDVAASAAASVFTTSARCDNKCETALLTGNDLLGDKTQPTAPSRKARTLKDESFSVSSAM